MTLHKGVDNALQFQFLNQEQKPVDITDKEITCRIISMDGSKLLFQKALNLLHPLTGIAVLNVNASDLESIDSQKCHYSLEIPVNSFNNPVYIDNDAGARGHMNIVDSVLPSFKSSIRLSIPTSQLFPPLEYNESNSTVTYTSGIISTENNSVITLQIKYSSFYGIMNIKGSTIVDGDWYTIKTETYTDTTETIGYSVEGYHPYLKVEFVSKAGSVTEILAR